MVNIGQKQILRCSKLLIKVLFIGSLIYITANYMKETQKISEMFKKENLTMNLEDLFSKSRGLSFTNLIHNNISLQTGRRNHDFLVMDESVLVNIAGRGIDNIETLNLFTGERSSFSGRRLDLHHIVAMNVHDTIYILCGLNGGTVDMKNASEFMYTFNWRNKTLAVGPRMRIPRGACGSLILNQMIVDRNKLVYDNTMIPADTTLPNTWTEDLICVFGGSIGAHDSGLIIPDVDC